MLTLSPPGTTPPVHVDGELQFPPDPAQVMRSIKARVVAFPLTGELMAPSVTA
jgi:hypothetical protein